MLAAPVVLLAVTAHAVTVNLEWNPPRSATDRIVVEENQGGEWRGRVVALSEGQRAVDLSWPASADAIRLGTPRHQPCILAAEEATQGCRLEALRILPGTRSRAWARTRGVSRFRRLEHLDKTWGEGTALPFDAEEVVVATQRAQAHLYLNAAGIAEAVAPDVGPYAIKGRLVERDGSPVRASFAIEVEETADPYAPEAVVARTRLWKAFYSREGVSIGKDGSFRIDPVAAEPLMFIAKFSDRPSVRFSTRRRTQGEVDIGTLVASKGARLSVSLENESELPNSSAFVQTMELVRPDPGTEPSNAEIKTNLAVGSSKVISKLQYGAWLLRLRVGEIMYGQEELSILDPETRHVWRLTNERVRGTVMGRSGDPVEGATVYVQHPPRASTVSDADGRFELRIPHAGGKSVAFCRPPGNSALPLLRSFDPRSAEADAIEFTVPSNEILLVVRDDETGREIEEAVAVVDLATSDETAPKRAQYSVPVRSGSARLSSLPDAQVDVSVSAKGYATTQPRRATLTPSNPHGELEFRLKRIATIRGVVLLPNGGAAAGARVTGPLGLPAGVGSSTTDGAGAFELPVSPDGRSVVSFWSPGFRLSFASVSPGASDLKLRLELPTSDSELELESADGVRLSRAGWSLQVGGVLVDGLMVMEAFRGSGCSFNPFTSEAGVLPVGGCLGQGAYSLSLRTFTEGTWKRFGSEVFELRPGIQRLRAAPSPVEAGR